MEHVYNIFQSLLTAILLWQGRTWLSLKKRKSELCGLTTYLLPVFATMRVGTHTVTNTAVAVENKEKIHIIAEVFKNSSKGK